MVRVTRRDGHGRAAFLKVRTCLQHGSAVRLQQDLRPGEVARLEGALLFHALRARLLLEQCAAPFVSPRY